MRESDGPLSGKEGAEMKIRNLLLVTAAGFALSGCAGTIAAGFTISQLSTVAGLASSAFTGKDLGEHALSMITGQDCRFLEGLLRGDRDICEDYGSLATKDDFQGVFAFFSDDSDERPAEDVLARYAMARNVELASLDDVEAASDEADEVEARPVTPAGGEGFSLRRLTFTEQAKDGPRVSTRLVYMMEPIADEPEQAAGVPQPKPVLLRTADGTVMFAPIPQPKPATYRPAVEAKIEAVPAAQLRLAELPLAPAPAPVIRAVAVTNVAVTNMVALQNEAAAPPVRDGEEADAPKIYWWVSGR